MKKFFQVGFVTLALVGICAGAFYATAPNPTMNHLPFPNMHRQTMQYAPVSFMRQAIAPDSIPSEANPVPVKAPEPKAKPPVKIAPRGSIGVKPEKNQVCELHALEQGALPGQPFVLYCHY